jgi:small subunit ribosomal protein S19
MARSIWKPPHVELSLLKKVKKYLKGERKVVIKTYSRSSEILPIMIGLNIHVYDGRKFIPVDVKEEMVGHKLGEFALTRTFRGHAGDKKGKKGSK